MLLNEDLGELDLVEIFCAPNSMMTRIAAQSGLIAARWTKDDVDLETEEGYQQAKEWLCESRPKRLWLSPECGPFSIMQNINQRTPEQRARLYEKRKKGLIQWRNCIRLAWVQLELGGYFYIEQPQSCMTWRLKDTHTRQLLDNHSTFCIRDQCFDDLKHPKSGLPLRKSTRIQSNDDTFTSQFAQRCTEHSTVHGRIEGGKLSYSTSFYTQPFCQRAVQIWKSKDAVTPKTFLKKFRDAQQVEEPNYTCSDCGSFTPTPLHGCSKCSEDYTYPIMPAVSELMQDIPEDDDGNSSLQKLMRVHRNLGHPPNRLLAQILKEAKAPESVIDLASNIECPKFR